MVGGGPGVDLGGHGEQGEARDVGSGRREHGEGAPQERVGQVAAQQDGGVGEADEAG